MATNSQHRCVFVGNIPYDATEEQLIQICEEVGPVVSFRLVIDRETGKPKGYGFCEYKDEETALSARRNLQGYEINGRQLRVDFAENDKGADRNREQGRGGPGLTPNVDAQKQLGGPVLGDSVIFQPIGLQLAATSASIMAGTLGGVQTDSLSSKQNGLPAQSGLGNDPLTHFLANMSRKQLYEVMSEMKVMATQNKELARQLLSASPQLSKALFQAQIMLGMVAPQVLQMPNIRQASPGSLLQPPVQDGIQDQKPAVLPPHPGQTSVTQNKLQFGLMPRVQEAQGSTVLPQNTSVNNQPTTLPFQQVIMQPRFHHPHQTQSQLLPQTTVPGQSGISTVPSLRPFTSLSIRPQASALETSTALNQQMQLPLPQNPRPVGAANFGHNTPLVVPNATAHNSLLPRPLLSQPSFQPGSSNTMISSGAPETVNKRPERSTQVTDDTPWVPRSVYLNSSSGLSKQTSMFGDTSEPTNHPSKLARLEDGRSSLRTMMNQKNSTSGSGPTPDFGTGSLPSNRIPSTEGQHSEKQAPQLAPEVESALLQQVMSLTSEQLSSLPPEQRQQVIQLQQMLR